MRNKNHKHSTHYSKQWFNRHTSLQQTNNHLAKSKVKQPDVLQCNSDKECPQLLRLAMLSNYRNLLCGSTYEI